MHRSWNKGFTKETHASVLKISETMRSRKIDNFARWRTRMKLVGKLKSAYPEFKRNGDLAELIGVTLGDGHIQVFPRTERLIISCNSANKGFVARYASLVKKIFAKTPTCMKAKTANCIRISIYQKFISRRLGVPPGDRKGYRATIPKWICDRKNFLMRYLRGLYEAEGSFCVHRPTSTFKLLFRNKNVFLLDIVYKSMKVLGYHPYKSSYQVQISRKKEVYSAIRLLQFRSYY